MSNLQHFFCDPNQPKLSKLPLKVRGIVVSLFVVVYVAVVGAGCKPSSSDKEKQDSEQTGTTAPTGDLTSTPTSSETIDSASYTPLQLAYARTLRLAEQGDPATLLRCDSLLSAQGPKGGAEPYYYKGIYFETKGDVQQAILWFDKTIQADYTFFEAYIEKASLLLEGKAYASALKELELLRTLSPGYAPVHYWLGKWAAAQGKKEMAAEHFELALSLDTSLTEARTALERLKK